MNSSNKHKRMSVDFNSIAHNKVDSKANTNKEPFRFRSLMISFSGNFKIKSRIFFNNIKKIKRFFYKRFFWGRGMYYKYSVFVSIIIVSIPVVVLAQNMKPADSLEYSNANRGSDTAIDNGAGKVQIADDHTIQSVHSYVVQPGDTVSTISAKFSISADTLTYVNNLPTLSVLQVGQTLKILPDSGILYKVQKNDTLESVAKKFQISQSGYSAQVLLDVNLLDSNDLNEGQELLVPGAVIPSGSSDKSKSSSSQSAIAAAPQRSVTIVSNQISAALSTPSNSGKFISPTGGAGNITTCFSSIHPAVDIDSIKGPIPLYAAALGTITYKGYGLSGGSGLAIRIDHGNGYVTEYLHFSQLSSKFSVGDNVSQGQYLGMMGQTGRSTGIHVHWIVKYNGSELNPMKFVDFSSYGREQDARGIC